MKFLRALQDAFSFLTIVPVGSRVGGSDPSLRMSRALAWFPLVGAAVGAAGAGVACGAFRFLPWPVASGLGLAAAVLLTGALHLDGFADTLDGLAGGKDRQECRRIMEDARVGVFGVVGLILLLGLRWEALQRTGPSLVLGTWVTAGLFSRLGMVLSAQFFPYGPGRKGLGSWVTGRKVPGAVAWAVLLALGGSLFFWVVPKVLVWLGLTLGVAALFNTWVKSRLGGITGDTLGAVNEILETLLLMAMVAG
ncbi:MAG: adenosylcobinamide-GDP ribazoletransferase [Candidatus Omnitrophica bacterium]|nr:adenosylcobinamide-GDP ribazoletransferase [Candidatus Omnitrophota bacterium]